MPDVGERGEKACGPLRLQLRIMIRRRPALFRNDSNADQHDSWLRIRIIAIMCCRSRISQALDRRMHCCSLSIEMEERSMLHVCLSLASAAIIPSLRFSSGCGLLAGGGACLGAADVRAGGAKASAMASSSSAPGS